MAGRRLPVAIGVIAAGALDIDCVRSILTVITGRTVRGTIMHRSGPYLDDARNEVCRRFLAEGDFAGFSHLLMVDSDIEFSPADVEALYDARRPVLSGVYHNVWGSMLLPVVHDWVELEDGRKALAPIMGWPDGWPAWPAPAPDGLDPIAKVTSVGAGFLMVERRVLVELGEIHGEPCPYFAEEIRADAHLGEDITFCLRAAEAGYPPEVHRGVQVGHHKAMRLGGKVD